MKKYAKAKISRRSFLSGGAIIGASALAAVAMPSVAAAVEHQEPAIDNKDNKKDGYRLTQHIADYYKSAAL